MHSAKIKYFNPFYYACLIQARSQERRMGEEGRGGGLPPARLKKVKFALNIKHALFDAML